MVRLRSDDDDDAMDGRRIHCDTKFYYFAAVLGRIVTIPRRFFVQEKRGARSHTSETY